MSPHAPLRTCVGCRSRVAKVELLRVVAESSVAGPVLVPDPRGRRPGRGAHVHPTPDCLALALRRRAFTRALRLTAGPDADQVQAYVAQLVPPEGS